MLPKASPNGPNESFAKAMRASSSVPANCSDQAPPRDAAMRRFWARMVAIYGGKWARDYGDACENDDGTLTVTGDTWRRGLSGVSEQQIAAGLQACLTSADPWPPTLPAFRALCLGIPPLAAILREITAHQRRGGRGEAEPTPFARLVWLHLDTYRMRHADIDKADRLIRDAYDIAREAVMRGEPLPAAPAGAIEAPKEPERKPVDPAVAAEHIARARAALGDEP
jgi:hypothetical protein